MAEAKLVFYTAHFVTFSISTQNSEKLNQIGFNFPPPLTCRSSLLIVQSKSRDYKEGPTSFKKALGAVVMCVMGVMFLASALNRSISPRY